MGMNIQRQINNIHRAIPDSPARKKRRMGGKKWNIHLIATKRRDRLESEAWSSVPLIVSLLIALTVAAAIAFR